MAFRPRARLMVILGSDQVTDPVTAAIELVKNAYDADATQVVLHLEHLADREAASITIRDDGFGMTQADIQTKWLSPAVGHKQVQKAARIRTARGRSPIGEKGVGRFSTNKLGHRLDLASRAAGQPEQVLEINWDQFEDDEKYLDEIPIDLRSRDPLVFQGTRSGTLLTITGLRDRWNRLHVRALHRGLRSLQSPFKARTDFRVILRCPEFPEFEDLDTSDILDRAHYTFRGYINEDGALDYNYESTLPGIPGRTHAEDLKDLLAVARKRGDLEDRSPLCGPFYLNLYVWDRRTDFLKDVATRVTREELDDHCGISVFRDGLRVLPYGDQGDDWLGLNGERVNDPSGRIGNNQVIGYVDVNQEDSPDLRDKTNREGLIDNEAFKDLRALVRAGIDVFTGEWHQDRPRADSSTPERPRKKVPAVQPTTLPAQNKTPLPITKPEIVEIAATSGLDATLHKSTNDDNNKIQRFLLGLNGSSSNASLVDVLKARASGAGLTTIPPGRYTVTVSADGVSELQVVLSQTQVQSNSTTPTNLVNDE